MTDLLRVESVEIALNRGANTGWARDYIMAHGLSAKYNPLGQALDRLEATITRTPEGRVSYSRGAFHMAQFLFSGILQKHRVCRDSEATDVAEYALKFFCDRCCPACNGTGVINIEQETCSMCGGNRDKPLSESLRSAVLMLESYQLWMEKQLDRRLSYWEPEKVDILPAIGALSKHGCSVTTKAPPDY